MNEMPIYLLNLHVYNKLRLTSPTLDIRSPDILNMLGTSDLIVMRWLAKSAVGMTIGATDPTATAEGVLDLKMDLSSSEAKAHAKEILGDNFKRRSGTNYNPSTDTVEANLPGELVSTSAFAVVYTGDSIVVVGHDLLPAVVSAGVLAHHLVNSVIKRLGLDEAVRALPHACMKSYMDNVMQAQSTKHTFYTQET